MHNKFYQVIFQSCCKFINRLFKAVKCPKSSLAILARRYLDWYLGFSYDPKKNGEFELIRNIRAAGFKTFFDVGANVGGWTAGLLEIIPDATVHCFEITSSTYEALQLNLSHKASCHHLGLSNVNAEIEYKDYGENSTVNTISNGTFWDQSLEYKIRRARVERGDLFCTSNGISFIDFLKVDVEGAEDMVLEGFSEMLNRKSIRLIQFEYGYANGDRHFLMKDFYHLFRKYDYEIGVVRKNGVFFKEFDYSMNDFKSGPNYVAIMVGDMELKEAIIAR